MDKKTKEQAYTIRYWPERISGEDGWSYEVRDAERRFRASGWSRGRKQHAEQDARDAIAKLQAPATREAVAS